MLLSVVRLPLPPLVSVSNDLIRARSPDQSPAGSVPAAFLSASGSNRTWALCGGTSGSLSRAKSVCTAANFSLSRLYVCKSRPDFLAFLCTVIRYWRSRTSGIKYSCETDTNETGRMVIAGYCKNKIIHVLCI